MGADSRDVAHIRGHAPGYLRDAFLNVVLDEYVGRSLPMPQNVEVDGEPKPLRWLLEQLSNCSDILPGWYRSLLDVQENGTYEAAVLKTEAMLEQQSSAG